MMTRSHLNFSSPAFSFSAFQFLAFSYYALCFSFSAFQFSTFSRAVAAETRQSFDVDPGWDASNNRPASKPVTIKQDFGYAPSPGRIGGIIQPAGEPAFYAAKIGSFTLRDRLSASGMMTVKPGPGNVLLGFFNSATTNEWRTPNSMVWRVNGRGDIFHVHFEYTTSKWRAGAGVIGKYDRERDRVYPLEMASGGTAYPWSLTYDPDGGKGAGTIKAVFAGHESVCDLSPGHKADGAIFDRFGLLNVIKSVDSPGELWMTGLSINGKRVDLAADPGWEGLNNRRTCTTTDVRPWFDFGWAPTQHAGGKTAGELGGRFFRGDCRDASRMACYGDRLSTLSLDKPLKASGRIVLRKGVSDSTTLLGFFHRGDTMKVSDSQASALPANVIGIAVEGPSSEGFFVYPVIRGAAGDGQAGYKVTAPRIYPDGVSHEWSLEYDPAAAEGRGAIIVKLDGHATTMDLPAGYRSASHRFNRFGLVTPWIDGNEQMVFFDDLVYTSRQE